MNGYTLVPHEPAQSFMLRKMNYDVPSPILTNYDWPHPQNQPPFDAQLKTSAMLTMNNRAYVLNGMGTGKTRAALWAWDYLNKNKLAGKLLVVAPLSTLKFTWAREVFATLPARVTSVLHGSRIKRLEALAKEADVYVINHDGIKVMLDALSARKDINTLVLDELATYRNGQSQRTKTMRILAQRFEWVWGMTGAPIPTLPTDSWAQASIVTPNTVPRYFKGFREDLMVKINQFKWIAKPEAPAKAFAVLQPAVRFTLDDVVELPEAIYRTMDIELGPTQAKVYKELAQHCYVALQNGEITAANAGAALSKLLQVSTGYVYTADKSTATLDNDKRIEALIDAVLSNDGKVMVFVPFKHALAGISLALKNEGIDHAVVSGDTSASERGEIFNLFQNTNKYHVLAAHPQCLAHGLTLTAANCIIWFSPTMSLEIYDQANMRIRRVGQKSRQLYLHFQGTPVERRAYQMLQNKQNIQTELLSLFEEATLNAPIY
jgi:SNF2 family DNA or RNA helicase